MPRLELYPFTYFDVRTRRWWRARYLCELEEATERYAAVRVLGKPEVRVVAEDLVKRYPTRPGG